jgi:hypothetical protein
MFRDQLYSSELNETDTKDKQWQNYILCRITKLSTHSVLNIRNLILWYFLFIFLLC